MEAESLFCRPTASKPTRGRLEGHAEMVGRLLDRDEFAAINDDGDL